MSIKPVSLPSSAGIDFGGGDVRHFAEGDAMSVPAIANSTRQLAHRDSLLAEKLNEVVGTVNNKEQFVNLSVPRTLLPPLDTIQATNFRIPPGFEARILSAIVAGVPPTESVQMLVYYAAGFGNSTGAAIVDTSKEFTAGTSFYQNGEFIVVLKNRSGSNVELLGSIMISMRPIGSTDSILVPTVIVGEQGPPGMQGVAGPIGPAGGAGAAAVGFSWQGPWQSSSSYQKGDAVSKVVGTVTNAYICILAHTSNTGNAPDVGGGDSYWDVLASGSVGAVGPVGPEGPSGTVTGACTFATNTVNGTFITGSDYLAGTSKDGYTGWGVANTQYINQSASETVFSKLDDSGLKLGFVMATYRRVFKGSGTLRLPQGSIATGGGSMAYSNRYIQCTVTINGSLFTPTGFTDVICYPMPWNTTDFYVKVGTPQPQQVVITLFGAQQSNMI